MKKIIFCAFAFLFVSQMAFSASYNQLFIVGNGSPAGWAPDKAPEMTRVSEGIFTWTGVLTHREAGGDSDRFKFLVARDWHPSITCQFASPGHTMIVDGVATDLFERPTAESGSDNAFTVPSTGTYKVDIDLNAMKLVCTKQGENAIDKTQLYMVGSATTAGWEHASPVAMSKSEDGLFTWTGILKAGELKFLNKPGSWNNTICLIDKENPADASFDLVLGSIYGLNFRPLEASPFDNKLKVLVEAEYTLSVNLNDMTLGVTSAASADALQVGACRVVVKGASVVVIPAAFALVQSVDVYDLSGRCVATYNEINAGQSTVVANNLKSGAYLVRLIIDNSSFVQKVLVK